MSYITGKVTGVNGNLVSVLIDGSIKKNEVGFVLVGNKRLKGEVIRINEGIAHMQIYEMTEGIKVGDMVEFSGELMSVELGPGLLTQIYDGLQNPLADLAQEAAKISDDASYFLQRGMYLPGLPRDIKWDFHPTAQVGARISAGDVLGWVTEGIFDNKTMPGHKIMAPFALKGVYTLKSIAPAGDYTVTDDIATLISLHISI